MAYATADHLENHLGTHRYIDVADRDADGSADDAAVASALTKASSLADSYLAHLLPIPSPYPESLVEAVLAIATYRLAGNSATDTERTQYEDAIGWLRDVAKGQARLATEAEDLAGSPSRLRVEADDAEWTRDKSGGIF